MMYSSTTRQFQYDLSYRVISAAECTTFGIACQIRRAQTAGEAQEHRHIGSHRFRENYVDRTYFVLHRQNIRNARGKSNI